MSNKKSNEPLGLFEIKKLAKKIVSENPIYIPDEPTTVGTPENLNEELEEFEYEQSAAKKPKRSKE